MEPVGNYKDFIGHFHKRYDRIIEGNETVCFGILLGECTDAMLERYEEYQGYKMAFAFSGALSEEDLAVARYGIGRMKDLIRA